MSDSDQVTTIISEVLGEIPTRVIIVEELMANKVISKKKGEKRIKKIMAEMSYEKGMQDGAAEIVKRIHEEDGA